MLAVKFFRYRWHCATALKFLIVGGLNFIISYAFYLAIIQIFSYRIAYTFSYLLGIFLAYLLQGSYVFQQKLSFSSAIFYPFFYLFLYFFGFVIFDILIKIYHVNSTWAPWFCLVFTSPVSFLCNYIFFKTEIIFQIISASRRWPLRMKKIIRGEASPSKAMK